MAFRRSHTRRAEDGEDLAARLRLKQIVHGHVRTDDRHVRADTRVRVAFDDRLSDSVEPEADDQKIVVSAATGGVDRLFHLTGGDVPDFRPDRDSDRSEEHTSELQSPYVISYAV